MCECVHIIPYAHVTSYAHITFLLVVFLIKQTDINVVMNENLIICKKKNPTLLFKMGFILKILNLTCTAGDLENI